MSLKDLLPGPGNCAYDLVLGTDRVVAITIFYLHEHELGESPHWRCNLSFVTHSINFHLPTLLRDSSRDNLINRVEIILSLAFPEVGAFLGSLPDTVQDSKPALERLLQNEELF